MKTKFKFSRLLALSALLVAGCAAYFSVFGLSQLFAGASIAVIVMASCLELSKIVAVSFLQRYWSRVGKGLRTYMTIGVVTLVLITSAGIYGFLSNAYQKTAAKSEIFEGQVGILTGKQAQFDKGLSDNQKIIDAKTKRIDQLTTLRTQQETRLDGATTPAAARRARADIESANKEIQKLSTDIDGLNTANSVLSDSSSKYSTKAIETKSGSDVAAELGPLKYLAELTGKPMGTVVNWFILLLIFVFDPLAVALVIAANKVMELEGKKKDEEDEPKPKQKFEDLYSTDDDDDEDNFPTFTEAIPVEEEHRGGVMTAEAGWDDTKTFPEPIVEVAPEPVVVPEPEPVVVPEPEPEFEPLTEKTLDDVIQEIHDVTSPEPEIPSVEEVVPELPVNPPTGKIKVEDIKEVKQRRGFSVNVPNPNIQNNSTNYFK